MAFTLQTVRISYFQTRVGTTWHELARIGTNWNELDHIGPNWNKLEQNEDKIELTIDKHEKILHLIRA